ncbi:PucR family transcriptional regulator [Dermacoccaceae bacterium W4C1]
MEELWPEPTPEVAEAIRTCCQALLAEVEAVTEQWAPTALQAQHEPALLSDASLVEEDRELNRSDTIQWLTSNVQHPGRRVEPYVGPRASTYIRHLLERGIAPDYAQAWRVALPFGWRRWLQECMRYRSDSQLLVELLDVSAQSLAQFALDSVAALREATIAAGSGSADADAITMIQLIANGAPVTEEIAQRCLRYRLPGAHVALVLWVDDPEQATELDAVIAKVRAGAETRNALVAASSPTARWVWLSGEHTTGVDAVRSLVGDSLVVRAAAGRPGTGLEGFRASHQDALAGQALVVRLGAETRVIDYADVELVDALSQDRETARRFVQRTLGELGDADAELRQALLTYLQCGFNATRAAGKLYAHRNTVERRVSRAAAMSAVSIEHSPMQVAAALALLELAPGIVDG